MARELIHAEQRISIKRRGSTRYAPIIRKVEQLVGGIDVDLADVEYYRDSNDPKTLLIRVRW